MANCFYISILWRWFEHKTLVYVAVTLAVCAEPQAAVLENKCVCVLHDKKSVYKKIKIYFNRKIKNNIWSNDKEFPTQQNVDT